MRHQLYVNKTLLVLDGIVVADGKADLSAAVDVYGEWVDAAGKLYIADKP